MAYQLQTRTIEMDGCDPVEITSAYTPGGARRMPCKGRRGTVTDAAAKMANLFRELWSDAEEESRSLRNLLAGAQEEVCSLTCRSHFPAGHVHSEADHSDKCRAITDALNDAALDSTDRAVVSAGIQKERADG